jgi:hypothetical protein
MTIEEVKKLSDDALREKVGNLACAFEKDLCCRCGKSAKMVKYSAFFCSGECAERIGEYRLDDGQQLFLRWFDYPNDLNMMYEVENNLSIKQWLRYGYNLTKYMFETVDRKKEVRSIELSPIHASARQRAEVFVLIMENE